MALRGEKKVFGWGKILLIIILIVIILAVWFFLFKFEECNNIDCFTKNLEECGRARYVSGEKMIFEYKILGEKNDKCEINVELLKGELNNQESIKLERQEMVCSINLGSVEMPGSDISKCTGQLKEGLQELLIKKLHTYIVQNLGRINYDLLEIPK